MKKLFILAVTACSKLFEHRWGNVVVEDDLNRKKDAYNANFEFIESVKNVSGSDNQLILIKVSV